MRLEVERLLAADESSATFLERPASELLGLMPELEAGDRLGPYRLLRRLGGGGMGTVYRAAAADGAPVAIKFLAPALADNPDVVSRFARG